MKACNGCRIHEEIKNQKGARAICSFMMQTEKRICPCFNCITKIVCEKRYLNCIKFRKFIKKGFKVQNVNNNS